MLDHIPRWASVRAHDHLRRSPRRFGGAGGFKEWHHVLVETDALSLLVNFSLTDDAWSPAPPEQEVARLILVARTADGQGFRGAAERFEPDEVACEAGRVDARFGRNRFELDGEVYRVEAALRDGSLAASLTLTPALAPRMFANQRLGTRGLLSWFLVPRLRASGWVRVGGRELMIHDAPAYHDHNWGHYLWGDDFVWEWSWGSGETAEGPWSVVVWRLADRPRGRATAAGVLLELPEVGLLEFVDGEVQISGTGLFRAERALKLPPVMAMLSPGTLAEVPGRICVEVTRGEQRARVEFSPEDLVQIIVPNETDDDGTTSLNEASGRYRLTASVGGRQLRGEGRGVFELLRG